VHHFTTILQPHLSATSQQTVLALLHLNFIESNQQLRAWADRNT